jgi:hypothetical protein
MEEDSGRASKDRTGGRSFLEQANKVEGDQQRGGRQERDAFLKTPSLKAAPGTSISGKCACCTRGAREGLKL